MLLLAVGDTTQRGADPDPGPTGIAVARHKLRVLSRHSRRAHREGAEPIQPSGAAHVEELLRIEVVDLRADS